MQMQEFSITFFWLISCTAVYSGIVEYRVIISNRGALCAYTVKHAPERSTAVPVRERVTSFILILPVSSSAIWKCLLHTAPTSWNLSTILSRSSACCEIYCYAIFPSSRQDCSASNTNFLPGSP
jgi:hypothetical protein